MPGEFEPHAGCWMLWPERPDNWRLGGKPAQQAFAAVASRDRRQRAGVGGRLRRAVRERAPPAAACSARGGDLEQRRVDARRRSDVRASTIGAECAASTGSSMRGAGSTAGCTSRGTRDDAVAQKVLEIEGRDRYRAPFVLEGGAIHVDGQGTLITTEECLLNRNRNPGLTRDEIEEPSAALPECRGHRLARSRRASRRDRRPRRQPVRLREARRGGADLDRRPPRPAVRDFARRVRATDAGARRAWPALQGAQADAAGSAAHDGRGGPGRGCRRGLAAARGGGPHGGLVRQFLPRHASRGRPAARPEARRRRDCASSRPCSRGARWWACRAARSCSAAATCTASRSKCRARARGASRTGTGDRGWGTVEARSGGCCTRR